MPTTVIALKILLVLLPGYLTLIIKNSLSEKRARTDWEFVLTILLFDVIIFIGYLPVVVIFPGLRSFMFSLTPDSLGIVDLSLANGLIIIALSILLGVVTALVSNYDLLYKLSRALSLTHKSGRYSVWNDVFSEIRGKWIIVHLENGIRIMGWPRQYSADPEERCVFMAEAVYLGRSRKEDVRVKGPGVLITPQSRITLIEFLS
jgi:hypothetical protein